MSSCRGESLRRPDAAGTVSVQTEGIFWHIQISPFRGRITRSRRLIPPQWKIHSKGILPNAIGPETHAAFAKVNGSPVFVGCECEFAALPIFAKSPRLGPNLDRRVSNWMPAAGIDNDEADFKVGVTNPFVRWKEKNESGGHYDDKRRHSQRERFRPCR